MAWETVIGLEVHVELSTKSKIFCGCSTSFGGEPNSHTCPVCRGQPGALPRLNLKAVKLAAKAGLALGCMVNEQSLFSRKNYFYPDLPNGFQTSQLDPPICQGGELSLTTSEATKIIRLNRIHLEDDAGKCIHDEKRGITLVDLNRAGSPLIEIVTEPDLNSADEAVEFLKKLHNLLIHLEVTLGRMEEGEFRCDVNISLRPFGSEKLGTRGEIKNLNSFRFVGQAIDYEIKRQSALYEAGLPVLQETLHFDPLKGETRVLRSKEEAHDYRYFPQPDLPVVEVSKKLLEELRSSLPEKLDDSKARLMSLGLKEDTVDIILNRRQALEYFDQALKNGAEPKRLGTLMVELFLPACQKEMINPLSAVLRPDSLAKLAILLDDGILGRRAAFDLFGDIFAKGGDPQILAREKGVLQISDTSVLDKLALEVIDQYPNDVQKYLDGQEKVISFLVGQVMRRSRGAADPKGVGAALIKNLKSKGSL